MKHAGSPAIQNYRCCCGGARRMCDANPTSLSAVRALDDIPAHPVRYFCPIEMRPRNLSWYQPFQVSRFSKVTRSPPGPKASMDGLDGTASCILPLCWTIWVKGKSLCSISGKPLLWKESTPALATTNPELSCERSVVSGGFPTAEAIVGSQTLNQGQSHDPYRPGAGGRTRLDVGWRTEVA
jgi:hypothetical protein